MPHCACEVQRAWHLLRTLFTPCRHACARGGDGERGRREQRANPDSCRGERREGSALFIPPVQTSVTPCCFTSPACICCLTASPPYVSLCPGAQAHWSPLHPHLCSALQISASGTKRPGTTVSKSKTGRLYVSVFITTRVHVQECLRAFFFLSACVHFAFVWVVLSLPVICPSRCSCRMKMSPPSAEDSAGAPQRTTNYKPRAHHCPHVELVTELCSRQGRG